MFNYKDRVVVISGASSGLGSQMAEGFAMQGANLMLLARREERLKEVKENLEKYGTKIEICKCDVTSVEDIDNAVSKTRQEFGKVDVLVNCAGSAKNNGVLNMTDEEWEFTMKTDLDSVFYMTRAFEGKELWKNYKHSFYVWTCRK